MRDLAVMMMGMALSAYGVMGEADCSSAPYSFYGQAFENPTGSCSGHGECDNVTQVCTCESGWTGRSDFFSSQNPVTGVNYDCQIFEPAIKGLWIFLLTLTIIMQVISIPRLRLRYAQYLETKSTKAQTGHKYPIWRNRALMATITYSCIGFPSIVAFAVLRLIDDQERIGLTYGVSILFILVKIGFFGQIFFYQPALVTSILVGSKNSKQNIKVLVKLSNSFALFNFVASVLIATLPLFQVIFKDEENMAIISYLGYFGGTTFTLIFYGSQSTYLLVKSRKLLNQSYSLTGDSRIAKIKDAISDSQKEGIRQAWVQCLIYGTFLFFPFLYNKHDYFLPIGWIAYPLISKKIAFTAISNKTSLSTSAKSSDKSKDNSFNHGGSVSNTPQDGSSMDVPSSNITSSFAQSFKQSSFIPASPVQESTGTNSTKSSGRIVSTKFRAGVNTFFDPEEHSDDDEDDDHV